MCRKSFLEDVKKSKSAREREESKGDSSSEQEGDNDTVYGDRRRNQNDDVAEQRRQLREIIDVV